MRKVTITRDRCGKEITNDINGFPYYLNDINIILHYGGEQLCSSLFFLVR